MPASMLRHSRIFSSVPVQLTSSRNMGPSTVLKYPPLVVIASGAGEREEGKGEGGREGGRKGKGREGGRKGKGREGGRERGGEGGKGEGGREGGREEGKGEGGREGGRKEAGRVEKEGEEGMKTVDKESRSGGEDTVSGWKNRHEGNMELYV